MSYDLELAIRRAARMRLFVRAIMTVFLLTFFYDLWLYVTDRYESFFVAAAILRLLALLLFYHVTRQINIYIDTCEKIARCPARDAGHSFYLDYDRKRPKGFMACAYCPAWREVGPDDLRM